MSKSNPKSDILELKIYPSKGFSVFFELMSFQVQMKTNQTPFTVTKPNTVQTGVFSYQPEKSDCIIGPSNSLSLCSIKHEHQIDEDNFSKAVEVTAMNYVDKLDNLFIESHNFPCLGLDGLSEPTVNFLITFL